MYTAGLSVHTFQNSLFYKCHTFHNFQRAKDIIKAHNASNPLFLYMAFQNVHFPVQAPQKYIDKYSFIEDETRRTYAGMVDIMDEAVGNITEAMKDAGYDSYAVWY